MVLPLRIGILSFHEKNQAAYSEFSARWRPGRRAKPMSAAVVPWLCVPAFRQACSETAKERASRLSTATYRSTRFEAVTSVTVPITCISGGCTLPQTGKRNGDLRKVRHEVRHTVVANDQKSSKTNLMSLSICPLSRMGCTCASWGYDCRIDCRIGAPFPNALRDFRASLISS